MPDNTFFHDFDRAWRIFPLMEATQWRWPPSVIEHEAEALLEDLLKIRSLIGIVEKSQKKES